MNEKLFSLSDVSIDDNITGYNAGYRNGASFNNVGENGNYWTSTPYESNTQNAYELYFNSGAHKVDCNNRNNGQSIRPVSELTQNVNIK